MTDNKRMYLVAVLAAGTLALAGCKKEAGAKEIELPEGQVHVGAQWVDGELWVESMDPKTMTCSFSQYLNGKAVDSTTITFKNCRVGVMGGPMMRPMMPGMPPHPGMMNRPGMGPQQGMAQPGGPRPGMMMPGNHPPAAPVGAAPQATAPAQTTPATP